MKTLKKFLMASAFGVAAATAANAATLDDVKAKGYIDCGVSQGLIGFSNPDESNNWSGLDVDFCKAVAAAVFGDATKVKYAPLSAKERFTALQSGTIDILSRNSTWTMSRDTTLGLTFAGVTYYDGQGFLVPSKLGVKSALELGGASVCTQTGTTTELNLADYFKANKLEYKVVAFEKNEEVLKAYQEGRCDVFTTDQSGLYAERLKFTNPDEHVVLPEIISKEPLGPVVRQSDPQWFNIVKWSYYALLNAEELGVTSANVDEQKNSANPEIQRLLSVKVKNPDGTEADNDFGKGIGLGPDWAYNIIKQVGNYSEIFERNVGVSTPLKIARGSNALWKDGGLQYAPPIR
ncbi:MAG: amino acid ABC transporter substrate-binding protein [Proteobacteria bacterium]|nr:amino acid ABC transporter substrate-binding protein [Pseudomonadota bacterium]